MLAEWRTGDVVAIARGMLQSKDFSALPILADALQDAGCTDEELLAGCRQPPELPVLAARTVNLIYSRETEEAVKCLDQFCADFVDYGDQSFMRYERLLEGLQDYLDTGKSIFSSHDHPDMTYDAERRRGMWESFEIVTGSIPSDKEDFPFRCSC